MANWQAVTKSGRVYTCTNGILTIEGDDYTAFKVWTMRAATMDDDALLQQHADQPWTPGSEFWEDVDVPVVGRRLYLSGKDNWRLSTPIKSVRVFGSELH